MFEHVPTELLHRAMQPKVSYGRRISTDTLHQVKAMNDVQKGYYTDTARAMVASKGAVFR